MSRLCSNLICGLHCTFTIDEDGNVLAFGENRFCKLAHPQKSKSIFPPSKISNLTNIKMISCGDYHTICCSHDGELFSFGRYGSELGLGFTNQSNNNIDIPQKIDIVPINQISCGKFHTMCLSYDNELWTFGRNIALGLGKQITCAPSPQKILGLNSIEFVECGGGFTMCKTLDNDYYTWGNNRSGELGIESYDSSSIPYKCTNWPNNIIDIKCGDAFAVFLTSEGKVYVCGNNDYGDLGLNTLTTSINTPTLLPQLFDIKRIECGSHHTLCIDIDNNLLLFGCNFKGQLGSKERSNIPMIHPTLNNILDISVGKEHTFIKTLDNKIFSFGNNLHSELGIRKKGSQYIPLKVFENNTSIWKTSNINITQKSARK